MFLLFVSFQHFCTVNIVFKNDQFMNVIQVLLANGANFSFLNFLFQHFLCDIDNLYVPFIRLTFSETELRTLKSQCDMYAGKMKQIAIQATMSR